MTMRHALRKKGIHSREMKTEPGTTTQTSIDALVWCTIQRCVL